MVLRIVALLLLLAFTAAGTATTIASFGAYCLTSYASLPGAVPAASRIATIRQERSTSQRQANSTVISTP